VGSSDRLSILKVEVYDCVLVVVSLHLFCLSYGLYILMVLAI
jgi:hypothetical protein